MDSRSSRSPSSTHYICDTLPEPQNLTIDRSTGSSRQRSLSPALNSLSIEASSAFDVPTREEIMNNHSSSSMVDQEEPLLTPLDPTLGPLSRDRKLCVRHLRMADEGTFSKLQRELDALPVAERQQVNSIWSTFSSSSHQRRATILQGILTMCCFSQLSYLTEQLHTLIRLDPFVIFPKEVSLKVLGYLDAFSLCRAAQVSRTWSRLADDDVLWHDICEQHIGQTCRKCGWGLPLMGKKSKNVKLRKSSPKSIPVHVPPRAQAPSPSPSLGNYKRISVSPKRDLERSGSTPPRPAKRQRSEPLLSPPAPEVLSSSSSSSDFLDPATLTGIEAAVTPDLMVSPPCQAVTRPWKSVYCERLTIERNWRRGRCAIKTLKGHTDGIMCMQFSENMLHPCFPILITGSYDRTARVWNMETGEEIAVLSGHNRAVRALQFDEAKLITGSMDRTLKVWNWRTGACIRTLEGHIEGIVCLNFDSNVLASGSVDTTIKIWNFRTGECFTLRGHRDWVNSLQLWDSTSGMASESSSILASSSSESIEGQFDIDPGKMLFSASDDGTIRLWDLNARTCVKTYTGHVGQVQSIKLAVGECPDEDRSEHSEQPPTQPPVVPSRDRSSSPAGFPVPTVTPPDFDMIDAPQGFDSDTSHHQHHDRVSSTESSPPHDSASATSAQSLAASFKPHKSLKAKPVLFSGSLDNTIKIWDIETGKNTTTMFGHIEGVWAVACDRLRLVSGSHDRTIKIWSRDDNKCTATLVGHRAAVTCLALGDDKIVSGSDDGDIRIWSFAPQ